MVIYGQVTYGAILQPSTISNLLINNSHLVILAVGLTFVILTGGIDLSVGAVIAFSSVAGMMLAQAGWNPYLVVLIMVLIGSVIGLVSGCLIEFFDMQPFIATLSMMFLARGLASTLSTVPERLDPESPIKEIAHSVEADRRGEGQRPRRHPRRHHRCGRRGRRPARRASHPVRAHGLRGRRFGAVGEPDGPAGPQDQAGGVRHQRHARRASAASSTPLGSGARRTSPASAGNSTRSPPS